MAQVPLALCFRQSLGFLSQLSKSMNYVPHTSQGKVDKMKCMVDVWSYTERLAYKNEDPSSIPNNHIKKIGHVGIYL